MTKTTKARTIRRPRPRPRTVSVVRTPADADITTVYYGSAPGAYTRPFGGGK